MIKADKTTKGKK